MAWPAPRASVAPIVVLSVAMLLGGLSLLLGDALRVDPQGWLGWGRELALGDGPFSTVDYPSWKPLPVLVTVPLAFFGPLGPALWLVLARTGGILALALLFDLARRRAGIVAGVVAAGTLALAPTWWPTLAGGGIEPLIVALLCLAVDRHERGHPGQTLLLLCLVALGREEALVLVLGYGLGMTRTHGARHLAAATAGTVVALTLWLAGDMIGSGDALHGAMLAKAAPDAVAMRLSGAPWSGAAVALFGLLAIPLWPAAAVGAAGALRSRDRTLVAVLAGAGGWALMDVLMTVTGYPLPTRFLFPVAAALALAAGTGAAALRRALVHAVRGAPGYTGGTAPSRPAP